MNTMAPLLAFLSALWLPLVSTTSLLISISPSPHLPNPQTLSASTQATLLSGSSRIPTISTPLTTRSTLEFHNLTLSKSDPSPRSYLLLISSLTHVFASYRVDVIPGGTPSGGINYGAADSIPASVEGVWETYRDSPWEDRGVILGGKAAQDGGASGVGAAGAATPGLAQGDKTAAQGEQVVHIEAKVLAKRNFYEQSEGFNPLGMLANPMILLAIAAMGLTLGLPYLIDNCEFGLRSFLLLNFTGNDRPGCFTHSHRYLSVADKHDPLSQWTQIYAPNSRSSRRTVRCQACTKRCKTWLPRTVRPLPGRTRSAILILRAGWLVLRPGVVELAAAGLRSKMVLVTRGGEDRCLNVWEY